MYFPSFWTNLSAECLTVVFLQYQMNFVLIHCRGGPKSAGPIGHGILGLLGIRHWPHHTHRMGVGTVMNPHELVGIVSRFSN